MNTFNELYSSILRKHVFQLTQATLSGIQSSQSEIFKNIYYIDTCFNPNNLDINDNTDYGVCQCEHICDESCSNAAAKICCNTSNCVYDNCNNKYFQFKLLRNIFSVEKVFL